MTSDDCNPHGIPRPSRDELTLRRRLRVLREILQDADSPFRARLIDLTDMCDDTERGLPMPRTTASGERRLIDLPGSPPPRRGRG